jgi:hypothetical protein
MSRFSLLITFLCTLNMACVHNKWDKPSEKNNSDVNFSMYKTIAELRSGMGSSGYREIKENIIITGEVIADDRTGNFYRQIIIDDGTAAIPILLDASNLYNDFSIGRKIYLRCKGLYTNFYYKLPQLGYIPDQKGLLTAIPYQLWDKYIIAAEMQQAIKAIEVSIADAKIAKPELFNRLVSITDAQILDTSRAIQYALPAHISSATNIQLMDCDSNTIALRTSAYSSLQAIAPPKGRGKITAIYTVFNNTPQLVLRDTSEIDMKAPRCF